MCDYYHWKICLQSKGRNIQGWEHIFSDFIYILILLIFFFTCPHGIADDTFKISFTKVWNLNSPVNDYHIWPTVLTNCSTSQVRRNVTDVAYHIAQYTNIIAELREEIARLRTKVQGQSRQAAVANIQAVHCK